VDVDARDADAAHPAVGRRLVEHAAGEPELRVRLEALDQLAQVARRHLDVAVELHDVRVLAPVAHRGQADVEGPRRRRAREPVAHRARRGRMVLDDGQERHLALEPAQDLQRAVVGAVVDDDPAGRRELLGGHGADHALDVRRLVAHRRDDEDARALAHAAS
jgi:hypothetical protein